VKEFDLQVVSTLAGQEARRSSRVRIGSALDGEQDGEGA
jgi:hypothetical protein